MTRWTELVAQLDALQAEQLFDITDEVQKDAGDLLIEEAKPADAMWLVLDGLLRVETRAVPGVELARLGPGEMVGDMSFLDGELASASVIASEPTRLLHIPHARLKEHLARHTDLAAMFYRSLAETLSDRLRRTNHRLGGVSAHLPAQRSETWIQVMSAVREMQEKLLVADRRARKGALSSEVESELARIFTAFSALLERVATSDDVALLDSELGHTVQRELLPYILTTEVTERMYSKPNGYAGDFLTIDKLYQNVGGGSGRLGPLLDRMFLAQAPARAVRNRRHLMAEELDAAIQRGPRPLRVLALACGPAREVFDVLERLEDPSQLEVTLLDVDPQAIGYIREQNGAALERCSVDLIEESLAYLTVRRRRLDRRPYDFAYSIGVLDYFSDKLALRLVDWIYEELAPGGRVMLGNFHPNNPGRAFMTYVLEWDLLHRTEADLDALFLRSSFGRKCTRVRFEPEHLNLFAECTREG